MEKVLEYFKKRYGKSIENFAFNENKDLFRLLITTVLSQRSKDETTEKVSEKLFSYISKPEDVLKLGVKNLEKIIRPSGPFRQKAKRIFEISRILVEKYPHSFPRKREELLSLPGVGPKTADVVLSYGFGEPVIAVDTHVEIVSKRLGLVREKAKYEEIRKTLESFTKEKDRFFVNLGFVNFGKEICITQKPKCDICPFVKFCKYYKANINEE